MANSKAFSSALLALACALPAPGWSLLPGARAPESAPAPAARSPFIIDPGHGGEDLGAVVFGRREKDIALAIARKVSDRLQAAGSVPVRLTRDYDTFLPLNARVDEALEWRGAAFISLHLNQVRARKASGITVYAFGPQHFRRVRGRRRGHVPPLPAPPSELARRSAALADAVARSLRSSGFKVDPPATAPFYVLKNPGIPSILIELGYLSNPKEAKRLADPAYQDRLAEALCVSLQAYLAQGAPLTPAPAPAGRTAGR
jgi:N-acetylmuramoyl-L-alanine amidase